MLLAIDIGNTAIEVGLFLKEELTQTFCLGTDLQKTADEYAFFLKNMLKSDPSRLEGIILGSVVPSLTKKIKKALSKLTGAPIFTVGPGMRTGFPLRIDNPKELGADLAANAAGALEKCAFPVIVADFGNVTTLLVLDDKGAYRGGCFMPGVGMSLDSLKGAELLPSVPAEKATSVLGTNTADCMRAGVLRGQAFSVMGFVKSYKAKLELPANTPLLVTGDYAPLILPNLPQEILYEEHLTLRGLAAIYRFNKK